MTLEIGSEVEGVVTGITNYGAFVRLPKGNTGLIHISEVADAYVKDVRNFLNEKDKVVVRILGKNKKGKFDLSLKQVEKKTESEDVPEEKVEKKPKIEPQPQYNRRRMNGDLSKMSFEQKLSRFMKESEERILDLKRNTEAKRGRGRGR